MPRTRGEANQSLYRAQVLLACWDRERSGGRYSDHLLRQAFLPAVRLHLCAAYGWFLLAVSGVEEANSANRPERVADLPAPEPGRARPPELQEFSLLESDGWVADMLSESEDGVGVGVARPAAGAALLVSDRAAPDFALAMRWAESLEAIMLRMDDSLAEC